MKYDETYMPKLFPTPPKSQNEQNAKLFLMFFVFCLGNQVFQFGPATIFDIDNYSGRAELEILISEQKIGA